MENMVLMMFVLVRWRLYGPDGLRSKIPMGMREEEIEKLKASAEALKSVIAQIEL